MMSLSHAPDVIGLFFSVLNQFTQTATFIADGEIITIQTPDGTELMGKSVPAKLFCAVVNWFGHIMSDVAGSSGTRGKAGNGLNDEKRRRGSGVVIPFYELLGLCDFGSFQVGKSRDTLATLARKVYETGYDARWGITMSIPVAVCDLSIRLVWAVRQYFGEKRPLKTASRQTGTRASGQCLSWEMRASVCWTAAMLCSVRAGSRGIFCEDEPDCMVSAGKTGVPGGMYPPEHFLRAGTGNDPERLPADQC